MLEKKGSLESSESRLFRVDSFFHVGNFEHRDLFAGVKLVWEALVKLQNYLEVHVHPTAKPMWVATPMPKTIVIWNGRVWEDGFIIHGGDVTKGSFKVELGGTITTGATVLYAGCILWDERIQLGPGSVVEPGALIKGPTIIGAYTEIRQGAYVRGKCLIGDRCVVGHVTEMKASIMLDGAKAGHFAYIGDSIIGNDCNLGAGTKLANLKLNARAVGIKVNENHFLDTGLQKLGAIIGDQSELGCNVVTNPGTLLGKRCLVLPSTSVAGGWYPDGSRLP